jgi:coenzyme F420-reducing hydrogenase beta subunit
MVKNFDGKIAVVMLPCQIRAINMIADAKFRLKIAVNISLFCGCCCCCCLSYLAIQKSGLDLSNAKSFMFRNGHKDRQSVIINKDGTKNSFAFSKITTYRNAYFFYNIKGLICDDHFGYGADISLGDFRNKEMLKKPFAYNACIVRTQRGRDFYKAVCDDKAIIDHHISGKEIIQSQKRALVFKFNCALAKKKYFKSANFDTSNPCRWNHKLVFFLARYNQQISHKHKKLLRIVPFPIVYCYMLFMRLLLNF